MILRCVVSFLKKVYKIPELSLPPCTVLFDWLIAYSGSHPRLDCGVWACVANASHVSPIHYRHQAVKLTWIIDCVFYSSTPSRFWRMDSPSSCSSRETHKRHRAVKFIWLIDCVLIRQLSPDSGVWTPVAHALHVSSIHYYRHWAVKFMWLIDWLRALSVNLVQILAYGLPSLMLFTLVPFVTGGTEWLSLLGCSIRQLSPDSGVWTPETHAFHVSTIYCGVWTLDSLRSFFSTEDVFKEKRGVWDPMLELAMTSPYLIVLCTLMYSIAFQRSVIMKHGQPTGRRPPPL